MKPAMILVTGFVAGVVLASVNIASTPKVVAASSNIELVRLLERRTGAFMFTVGDTLKYTARWPKWKGATSYQYSVRASAPNWTVPTNVVAIDSVAPFILVNTTAWDSVTFRLVVKGINTLGVSKDSVIVSWRVVRPMAPGGPPVIDSSRVVWALIVKPDSIRIVAGTAACAALGTNVMDTLGNAKAACKTNGIPQVVQFCAFFQMLDKKYYMGETTVSNRYICRRQYDQLPAAGRLPGYPNAQIAAGMKIPSFKIVINDSGEKWSRTDLEIAVN